MTNENRDILFEKRDIDTPAVTNALFWMLVVMLVSSLLMIPLTNYLWSITSSKPTHSEKSTSPQVILEVSPSQELQKMKSQISDDQDHEKIDAVMSKALKQGFVVRKS